MQEQLHEVSSRSHRRSHSSGRSSRSRGSRRLAVEDIGVHNLRDVKPCFEPLQQLAHELGTPLACLRLDRHGVTDKKTFFDRQRLPSASSSPSSAPSKLLFPALISSMLDHSGPGAETTTPDIDKEGGNTVFAIGSLVKVFINLVFCVLICQDKIEGLTWETKVFELYNKICDRNNEPPIPRLDKDPTVIELLLHKHSFAPMIRFFLAPDGVFLPTCSEFLQYAVPLSNHFFRTQNPKPFNYSNANHIFAALLLEKILGDPFSKIMRDKLFSPLKMTRTIMDPELLTALAQEGNVASGHRVSTNLWECTPTTNTYLESTAQAASFGARSCTNDLASLFRELFAAVDGKSQIFSKESVQYFFGTYSQLSHVNPTLAGTYCTLESGALGSDSFNAYSRTTGVASRPALGTRANKSIFVFYKGGITDGFTCSVCVSVSHKTSLVVLSNSNGPIDFCDYASRYMLQEVFETQPPVDIVNDAREDMQLAKSFLVSLYDYPEIHSWSDSAHHFIGDFEHVVHKQKLSISSSGNVTFSGAENHSMAFQATVSGSVLRVILKEREGVVDHRHEWKDLNFELMKKFGKYYLVGAGGADYYEKL